MRMIPTVGMAGTEGGSHADAPRLELIGCGTASDHPGDEQGLKMSKTLPGKHGERFRVHVSAARSVQATRTPGPPVRRFTDQGVTTVFAANSQGR
jgi:hypothetical protein